MTKPLPSLALDMSQHGIALHQLAFDGHWHELARVALDDASLRARLSNMRSIASKLEGRRFKARIWLPEEQILWAQFSILGNDDKTRKKNARGEIAAQFGGKPHDYVVQLGKRVEGGSYPVAAVRLRTLQEARTFAKSHGFKPRGYSTQAAIEGFTAPPVFDLPADKFRALGLGLVASTAAAAVLGGGFAFYALDPLNLWEAPPKVSDFAPFQQPNPGIERAGGPPAPTLLAAAPSFPAFAALSSLTTANGLPYLPPRQLTADALEHITRPAAPTEGTAPTPPQLASAPAVNWPLPIAPLPAASAADPLPSVGLFSLQDRIADLTEPDLGTPPPAPSGPVAAYRPAPRPRTVANTAFYLEPLPAMATRLSPSDLAAFASRSGLSMAQLSQTAPPLLLIESRDIAVIKGLPPILPRLRSGRAIPEQVAPPPAPVITAPAGPAPLFALVSGKPDNIPPRRPQPPVVLPPEEQLPFRLISGAPDIRPLLRPAAVPPATETAPVATLPPTAVTIDAPATAPDTHMADAVDAALATAAADAPLFTLLEGQPPLLPRLRSGAAIPPLASAPDPATAAANALRPLRRPQAIIDLPAPIDPMISGGAPITATRALHRGPGFAANAARIIAITASRPRVTAPTVPTDPRTVNLPTSASVARAATIENAINLRKTNLLGVFGTAENRTALILLSNGQRVRVRQGDVFSGWTVVAIATDNVRIRKRNREEILRMPAE